MNKLLICRLLGLIALLLGVSMAMSLPWAFPILGETNTLESRSILGLLGSMLACGAVGTVLVFIGRKSVGQTLFRREAIVVVTMSWLLATVLGAMPFWLSGTCCRVDQDGEPVLMDVTDGLFESASGFSGTGATVLTSLDNSEFVPRAILFWRSETHFLGGLGIMVLFVSILGMGSSGKSLMLTEMPGPSQEAAHARIQRAAWIFATIFVTMTVTLAIILMIEQMRPFDAFCHAFGTIATGGFSTHDKSIEYFNSASIEITIACFMIFACTNFTLLYYVFLRQPSKLLADLEFRVYISVLFIVTVFVVGFGLIYSDFANLSEALRYGAFQVISIMTNTGFGTNNFDKWNSFSRGLLFLLMFVGGCAGSTSCSIKVIRHIVLFKTLRLELEKVFHPTVVRHIRIGNKSPENPDMIRQVLVYFGMFLIVFIIGWMLLVAFEPDATWAAAGHSVDDKLMDCASAVAATLNGVGPGLGIVGESENYAHFHAASKFILTWLMLLGRLELFILIVIFMPRFWRSH